MIFLLAGFLAFAAPPFRLHLISPPTTLSPFVQKTSVSGYFLSQLSCPLLKWDNSKPQPWGGSCRFLNKSRVECKVDPELRFQNGEKVTALHYKKSFQAFLNPERPSPRAEILFPVKNARAILQKQKSLEELGIKADKDRLTIELENPDPDFLLGLSNSLLTAVWDTEIPNKNEALKFVSCGPYQIESWTSGKPLVLKPNPYFKKASPFRPRIEFTFISEDSLALQAYQKGTLDFLRRLPTAFIPKWEDSKEFFKSSQIRFDYFTLSEEFRSPDLARALFMSIDYEAWRKLYHAKPRPGCFGLPESWTDGLVCWDYDLSAAKAAFEKVKNDPRLKNLKLYYSKQGGDDHERTVEFLQDQWKKNLGIRVPIEGQENKIFIQNLAQKKFPLFRKGLSPERPSCLAVMRNFIRTSPENYPGFQSSEFEKLVDDLGKAARDSEKTALCRKAAVWLRDQGLLVGTGPTVFALLAKPEWEGWFLNELNQLDLSQLRSRLLL